MTTQNPARDTSQHAPPDAEEFPATWAGGHALVIEFGDEEFTARCQCGYPLGSRPPTSSLDLYQEPWERHVMRRDEFTHRPAAVAGRGPAGGEQA